MAVLAPSTERQNLGIARTAKYRSVYRSLNEYNHGIIEYFTQPQAIILYCKVLQVVTSRFQYQMPRNRHMVRHRHTRKHTVIISHIKWESFQSLSKQHTYKPRTEEVPTNVQQQLLHEIRRDGGPGEQRVGRSRNRISVRAKISAHVHTGPRAHPTSCTIGTESLFQG